LVWGPQMINLYHRPYKWGLSSMTPTRKDSWLWVPQVRNLYKSVLPQLQHYYNTTTDLPHFWWGPHKESLIWTPKEGLSIMGRTHKDSSVWVPQVRFLSDAMIPQLHYCWVENPYLWGP
jgi:hypothetical protein